MCDSPVYGLLAPVSGPTPARRRSERRAYPFSTKKGEHKAERDGKTGQGEAIKNFSGGAWAKAAAGAKAVGRVIKGKTLSKTTTRQPAGASEAAAAPPAAAATAASVVDDTAMPTSQEESAVQGAGSEVGGEELRLASEKEEGEQEGAAVQGAGSEENEEPGRADEDEGEVEGRVREAAAAVRRISENVSSVRGQHVERKVGEFGSSPLGWRNTTLFCANYVVALKHNEGYWGLSSARPPARAPEI